jgi:four helix bundle protein
LSEEFRTRARTFAGAIIRLFVRLPKGRDEILVCGRQMLRSGTSVAAHVREASRARSDSEFVSKLGIALQEADETQLWLELLREDCGLDASLVEAVETEAGELIAIMTAMVRKTRDSKAEG